MRVRVIRRLSAIWRACGQTLYEKSIYQCQKLTKL